MKKLRLYNINISGGSFLHFLEEILAKGKKHQSSYVCVANVHMCIEVEKDEAFRAIVNNADIITPDGKPIVLALRYLYGIEQEKVSGPDLMPALLRGAEENHLKVFYYGATPEVLEKLVAYTHEHYPALTLAGAISPPFRALSHEEQQKDIDTINQSGAHLVFVALGCPKQEKWMAAMKGRIHACMIGVGGAFPMLVGIEKRAPQWMQNAGLEWFYRLAQDPKRLFKRYLITNSWFIYLFIKEKIKITLSPSYKKAEIAKRIC